jgi:hypothetical protein
MLIRIPQSTNINYKQDSYHRLKSLIASVDNINTYGPRKRKQFIAKRSLKRKFGHSDITEQIKLTNNIITNDLQITKSIKNAMNRLKT